MKFLNGKKTKDKLKLIPVWHGYPHSWQYPINWFRNISQVPDTVKEFIQRGRYGVAPSDCWNLDGYLCNIMQNGLRQYKEKNIGYPCNLTPEEWDNVIDRMLVLLEIINTDSLDFKEPEKIWKAGHDDKDELGDWNDPALPTVWVKAIEDAEEFKQECLDEFCDLMKEYFHHLWW